MSDRRPDRPKLQTAIVAFFLARTVVSILVFVGGLAILAAIVVAVLAAEAYLQVSHPLP